MTLKQSWFKLHIYTHGSSLWHRGSGHLEDLKRPGEEICRKNLQEEPVQNRDQWKHVINRLTSWKWAHKTLKGKVKVSKKHIVTHGCQTNCIVEHWTLDAVHRLWEYFAVVGKLLSMGFYNWLGRSCHPPSLIFLLGKI